MKRGSPQTIASASVSGVKQPSPRARRSSHETKPTSTSTTSAFGGVSSSSQHFRSAGASSAFGPVLRRTDPENDQEQEPSDRDLYFLQANANEKAKPAHHNRGGSDCDFESTLLQLVSGTRGNSPHTVSQSTLTRPIRPTMRATYSNTAPSEIAQTALPPPPSASPAELLQATSRSNSPANLRPASPTTGVMVRQPTSPQLAGTRAPSPTTASIPFRPQSPPQIVSSANAIRPRSQSLDSKAGAAQPLPNRAAPGVAPQTMSRPTSTMMNNFTSTSTNPSPSPTMLLGASAIPSKQPIATAKPALRPMGPMNALKVGGQPTNTLASTATQRPPMMGTNWPSSASNPSSAANSPLPSFSPQLSADLLAALAAGDAAGLTDDQLDALDRLVASMREQRKKGPQQASESKPTRTHRPKEDSLDEVSQYWQSMEDSSWYSNRPGSLEGGRMAPNMKMFESQVPGEETRGTVERKPGSPNPWYLNAPAHPLPREDSVKIQPRLPSPSTVSTSSGSATVPDPTRIVNIVSPTSAFSLSQSAFDDEVKHEDPVL